MAYGLEQRVKDTRNKETTELNRDWPLRLEGH